MGSAIRIYRVSNYLYRKKCPFLPGLFVRLNRLLFSIDLPASVSMGKGVYLGHNGLACVIHERDVIGENTKIYQNVTIGGRGQSGCPTIGKNVFIGCGACILGGINIGDNANIGSNAVVITDVPEGCTAIGPSAKIVKKGEKEA